METVPENVVNKTLYKKVKKEAKAKFDRYPSLYASSWITREYKKRGGKYNTTKTDNKNKKEKLSGQKLWYKEKWIQIVPYLEKNKIVDCGDSKKYTKACRPLVRVNDKTPPTIGEIVNKYGKEKVLKLAKKKNRDMGGRLNWINGTFTSSVKRSKVKPDKK
tara:strand:- start:1321 stop:1803 length:483 start_codon:yes stop_codon:yes gene_type:complete